MTLQSPSVSTGGTLSVAGGSALAFSLESINAAKVIVGVVADAFNLRRRLTFSSTQPKVNAASPGGYTQAKNLAVYERPITLADGKVTNNTISVSIWFHPETTDAVKTEMLDVAAQVCFDTDFSSWAKDQVLI